MINNNINFIIKIIIYVIFLYILFKIIMLLNEPVIDKFNNTMKIPDEYLLLINDTNSQSHTGIPKIIHHICPKDFRRWHSHWFIGLESWLRLYPEPEYTHMYWYDDELNKFIESDFPWFLEMFNSYDVNIKRIDMIRPFILYKYGGIYSDMDYVVFKNFFDELDQTTISIPESPYKQNEFIQNALLISPPKHKFWLIIINEGSKSPTAHVSYATGPALFTNVYYHHKELITILPINLYNPDITDKEAFNSSTIYAKHLLSLVW